MSGAIIGERDCVEQVAEPSYLMVADSTTVWLQANRLFGNMVEGLSDDWQVNRQKAAKLIGELTNAQQVVRLKPLNTTGFVNLDKTTVEPIHYTDGAFTTNSELILHANPADCGEIAVHGFGVKVGTEVLGLIHASSKIVREGGHLKAIEYMATAYGVDAETMSVCLSPSARAQSYKFLEIEDTQREDPAWQPYLEQDESNYWHIDFHGRTIDDLKAFGVQGVNIYDTGIDTISHKDYFSHYRKSHSPDDIYGANGLMYSLRSAAKI